MTPLRCFVALVLPDDVKAALAAQQQRLRSDLPASWSRSETIHLTLHFLGDLAPLQADRVAAALARTCADHAPFRMLARGLGVFPDPRRPRVLWAGLVAADPSVYLRQALCDPLVACGVKVDPKAYHPHLTLARFRKSLGRQCLSLLGSILRDEQRNYGTVPVEEVRLYRSELLPSGARHTVLSTAALGR